MIPEIATSHFVIVLTVGATSYIGVLHILFWRWGRGGAAHLWASLFCILSLTFQIARYVQIHTEHVQAAIDAAKVQAAAAPVLAFCLVGFARTLREDRSRPDWLTAWVFVATASLAILSLSTSAVIPDVTTIRTDWAGQPFISVPINPGMWVLAPCLAGGFVYLAYEVGTTQMFQRNERQFFLSCLALYVGLCLASVASAMLTSGPVPILSQFSPLVVAVGLNYALLHRDRRIHLQLMEAVGTRTRELSDSEARYRSLVDNSPLGVIACDVEGRVIAANPGILQILGERIVRGRPTNIDLFSHPVVAELGLVDALRRCIETGQPWTTEITYATRSDRRVDLRLRIAAIRDAHGSITGVQAITEDIEGQKQLEDRLRQSKKLEAVGRLAAGIAHEINNPMAYVRSNLALMQREWSDFHQQMRAAGGDAAFCQRLEEHGELIEEAIDGVERTISIVRDVKKFSHGSSDDHRLVDLNEIIEDALRIATPRLSKQIGIERVYGALPQLRGSPGQLQQVFLNLVVNAIQAIGGSGTVWLVTRASEGEVMARVEDDGCGMDAHVLEHLFDPFFTTKAAGEGTGLGCYISYEIIRLHGGSIQVKSTPGEGTAFEVRLPIGGAAPGSENADGETRSDGSPGD